MIDKKMHDLYLNCSLCGRMCGVDRTAGERGFCSSSDVAHISRADLHMWEEPIISGVCGSGTIFFSGCSLGCVFCQNREISRAEVGRAVTTDELANIMLALCDRGAHNINLVTPTHYAPSAVEAVKRARALGMSVPVVYNTGSFDTVDTIRMLSDTVDVYLPDMKYYKDATARQLSHAPSYPYVAREAIAEMVRQKPRAIIENGLIKEGVVVRILLLPSHVAEAKLTLKYLYESYRDSIYISLMSQYTPSADMPSPLDRRTTRAEYGELVRYAEKLGVINAFIQDGGSSSDEYIPEWNKYII